MLFYCSNFAEMDWGHKLSTYRKCSGKRIVVISLKMRTKIEIADSSFFNEIYRFTIQNVDVTSRFHTFTVAVRSMTTKTTKTIKWQKMWNKLFISLCQRAKRIHCEMGMMEAWWWWDIKIVCYYQYCPHYTMYVVDSQYSIHNMSTGILLSSLVNSRWYFV